MHLCLFDDFRVGVRTGPDQPDHVVDVTEHVDPHVAPADRMTALIESWDRIRDAVAAAARSGPRIPVGNDRLRAPQPRPSAIVAAPVNYVRHQQEMGGDGGVYPGQTVHTIETYGGFVKASSSVVGPAGRIELPFSGDRRVDHEAELGVVIGRTASNVSRVDALGHVFGYLPLLDITLRGDEDRSYRKSFDTFTPIGPAIVTADEIDDPNDLEFALTVNGEVRQSASTRDLIYDVQRLIEFYSAAMTLRPGDIVATGTPEGVGPLHPSDTVVLTIERVGVLSMPVVAR